MIGNELLILEIRNLVWADFGDDRSADVHSKCQKSSINQVLNLAWAIFSDAQLPNFNFRNLD